MSRANAGSLEREGVEALRHMEEALRLIDSAELPVEVGAHLDLAICRLRDLVDGKPGSAWDIKREG